MDLKIISESITALASAKCYLEQILSLKSENASLVSAFSTYKLKVKHAIQAHSQEYTLKLSNLQQRIEMLEMQNAELLSLLTQSENNLNSLKICQNPPPTTLPKLSKFTSLLEINEIWNTLKPLLESKDIISLLSISELKQTLLLDSEIFSYLNQSIERIPQENKVEEKPKINLNPEQRDVNQLIEKYVTQNYTTGKQLDGRLKSTIQTLLRLYRPGEAPQQKFTSAADLVTNLFTFDKTIELLQKTTSTFSKNTSTMNDWLNFLHSTVAGLFYESAFLYIEASELSKLKDILVDKLRRAKEQIKVLDKENTFIKSELKKYKENKEHLVVRLHDTDLKLTTKYNIIRSLRDEIDLVKDENSVLKNEIKAFKSKETEWKSSMVEEIKALNNRIKLVNCQKSELLSAYEDLLTIFNSFSLKL